MTHYMDRSQAVRGSGYNTMMNPNHNQMGMGMGMGMIGNQGTQVIHFPNGEATPVNVTVRKSENVQAPAKIEVHAGAETGPAVVGATTKSITASQADTESKTETETKAETEVDAKPAATSASESDSESE